MQDGCLIWRDKKALMLAEKGAKIPDDGSVTTIAGGAFMYRNEMKEIEIPSSIEKINHQAFGCTELEKVTLNEGLKELDAYAFGAFEGSVVVPEGVELIEKNAFTQKTCVLLVKKGSYAHKWARKNKIKRKIVK
jgi:hypothetical protein